MLFTKLIITFPTHTETIEAVGFNHLTIRDDVLYYLDRKNLPAKLKLKGMIEMQILTGE